MKYYKETDFLGSQCQYRFIFFWCDCAHDSKWLNHWNSAEVNDFAGLFLGAGFEI